MVEPSKMPVKGEMYHGFPAQSMADYLHAVNSAHPGVPIVEVGSGDGRHARYFNEYHGINFDYLVDPAPDEYKSTSNGMSEIKLLPIAPHFNNVKELIAKKNEIVGNCIVVLIWSYPAEQRDNGEGRNSDGYDYEAICDLQPLSVISLYESDGNAGSAQFHTWLDVIGGHTAMDPEELTGDLPVMTLAYGAHRAIARMYHPVCMCYRMRYDMKVDECHCPDQRCIGMAVVVNVCLAWFIRDATTTPDLSGVPTGNLPEDHHGIPQSTIDQAAIEKRVIADNKTCNAKADAFTLSDVASLFE
jgi:hypothetical protein